MAAPLERLDRQVIQLRDQSFRWIVVKRFTQSAQDHLEPQELLALLLAHPSYRDDYASADGETNSPIHGPYRVDAVSPGSFDQVSTLEGEALLTSWIEQYGSISPNEIEGDLDAVYRLFREASAVYCLKDLGKDAQHDWGWVLGHTGFHEFVLVAPEGSVVLIVASDD